MSYRVLKLSSLFVLLTACADDPNAPSNPDDPHHDNDVAVLADMDPAVLSARVLGDGGGLLRELEMHETDTWSCNLSSGVLSLAVGQGQTMVQITLWQSPEVDETWNIEAVEGGLPTNATLTFIDQGYGGAAIDGEFSITAFRETDSPHVRLLDGTFDASPITNPDDPTWVRQLRDGELSNVRVTAL